MLIRRVLKSSMSISHGDGAVETVAARVCARGRIAAVRHVHAVVSGYRVAVVLLYGTERGKEASIRFSVSPADVPPVPHRVWWHIETHNCWAYSLESTGRLSCTRSPVHDESHVTPKAGNRSYEGAIRVGWRHNHRTAAKSARCAYKERVI